MVSRTTVIRVERPSARSRQRDDRRSSASIFVAAAPAAALLAGLAAEFLDFRALRYPLLLVAGAAVLATAFALFSRRDGLRPLLVTVLVGAATWGAAESLYVLLHLARGEAFDAPRFGAQWSQALGLIGVHALFLGVPTGIAAATLVAATRFVRRRA